MTSRTLPPAPSVFTSALRVMDLSIGEMLWSRRTVFMALIVSAPVLISLIIRALVGLGAPLFEQTRMTGPAIFGMMIWIFYLRFIVPVLGVFYGTSLIADEVEDRTITYLFTRPIRRGAVLVGKYLAYLVCTTLVVLPSVVLVYFLLVPLGQVARTFMSFAADLGLLALGLAAYGALFALVGAALKRPLVSGLVFVFGWEQVALLVPGYFRRFTVAHYVQSMVPHAMPSDGVVSLLQSVLKDNPPVFVCLLVLAAIIVATLWRAANTVESREYVLDQ